MQNNCYNMPIEDVINFWKDVNGTGNEEKIENLDAVTEKANELINRIEFYFPNLDKKFHKKTAKIFCYIILGQNDMVQNKHEYVIFWTNVIDCLDNMLI